MNDNRRKRRRTLTRREFLASSAGAGMALGLPGLLTGCGTDDEPIETASPTPTPLEGEREDRTLHFDLSFANVDDARLCILNSSDDGMVLAEHTEESREHFRDTDPLLRGVPDVRLTHFAVDVDLPADALQHFWLMGRDERTGEAALLGMQLHVPELVQRKLAAQKRAQGLPRQYSGKVRAYGLERLADEMDLEDLEPALDEFNTPWDAAAALVFHHSEIMNLDLDQGAAIRKLIETLPCPDGSCEPYLGTLAFRIAQHWPATESGFTMFNNQVVPAWAKLVLLVDPDSGMPLKDDAGNPMYRTDILPETLTAAQQTIRQVLKEIFNDPRFEGNNWHSVYGGTSNTIRAHRSAVAQATGVQLVAEYPRGTSAHGLDFVNVRLTDEITRTVELEVRNWHLRTHALHVQYFKPNGEALPVQDKGDADTARAKHVGLVITANTIMGIPTPFDTQKYTFNLPTDASKATLLFGSLGLGGDPFCPEALNGSIFTLIFNIAIPAIALAAGVKVSSNIFNFKPDDAISIAGFIGRFVASILIFSSSSFARGIFGAGASGNFGEFLKGLLNLAAQFVTQLVLPILAIVAKSLLKVASSAANVLFFGPQILGNLATLAELGQTIAEFFISPALFTNQLTFQMTTTVRIHKANDNFQFPARARHYFVTLIYDESSSVTHKQEGAIEPGHIDPIDVVFPNQPSGGKVSIDVILTTDEGFIIGRGTDATGKEGPIGPIANTPENATLIETNIKEHLIALTQATQYHHDLELKYQNGKRVWAQGPAPTATRAELCQGQDDRLCNLNGITMNQRTGMAGYGFQAGGQGDRPYCGETAGGVMHLIQNVFLAQDPERALKTVPCGFRQPTGIVYDRLGAADGRHFLQPEPDGKTYFLESVLLDNTTPFNLSNPQAWGRFTQALESLAVVATGHVVGVSRLNHKMEILELPSKPVDRATAPEAVPFAVQKGGEGTRDGLMNAPVAVAVFGATILVLETGNARIQAFDVTGNPVRQFKNGTSSTVNLERLSGLEYLDLGVEALGYMYVLSALNGGQTVSDYRLDIYTPQGNRLSRTTGVAAARLAVDTFRNVYTLNYASLVGAPRVEPSLSQWTPSTPG